MNENKNEHIDQSFLTPEQWNAFVEKARRELTEEDLKWFENPGELLPFEQIIRELEDFVAKEGLEGDEE